MKLENVFSVDASMPETWATLLDIQRVARCLPGATLESDGNDGVYRGRLQIKLGAVNLTYAGTVRMADIEHDEHIATIEARASEIKGAGTASASIRNQLSRDPNGQTRVRVETDLIIVGRAAQFGHGIMESVANNMLAEFAKGLEAEVRSGASTR